MNDGLINKALKAGTGCNAGWCRLAAALALGGGRAGDKVMNAAMTATIDGGNDGGGNAGR